MLRFFVPLLVLVASCTPAQSLTPQAALDRLIAERPAKAEWFSPEFLRAVPLEQINAVVGQLAALGRYEGSRPIAGLFAAAFEQGVIPARIGLDAQGRVNFLFFSPPRPKLSGFDQIVQELQKTPGTVSILVAENGRERTAANPDQPLAVGSAFKMAVLEALQGDVEAGRRKWEDEVVLEERFRSFGSAGTQNIPAGTRLSLRRLADLMISVSDNTATDLLIATLGRERVEAYAPRNKPFLTTKEAFQLKFSSDASLLPRYRAADEAGKRQILAELAAKPLPDVSNVKPQPTALDVEWFFTARELCAQMGRVEALPSMRLNPGLANRPDWQTVAYKGGSEPGVLNLTTRLTAKDGRKLCVAATFVNPQAPLDESGLAYVYALLLESLR